MKDADKIHELENRIAELEKQQEGAVVVISTFAPLLGLFGRAIIENGNVEDGAKLVVTASKLKNPENCFLVFKNAVENKEEIMALGKHLEAEIKKMG